MGRDALASLPFTLFLGDFPFFFGQASLYFLTDY